jgi:beta-N-acetylhexosaminidase
LLAAAIVAGAGWQWLRERQLSNMVGQMILVGFRGATPADASVQELARDIGKGRIGGVILFDVDVEKGGAAGLAGDKLRARTKSRNIIDVAQVKRLNAFLSDAARAGGRPPLFVSVDQEGGKVARLKAEHGFDFAMPTAKKMSKLSSQEITTLYNKLGARLKDLGFNLNFAPCVDIDVNPKSPAIGAMGRAFSKDPNKVARYGQFAAIGLIRAGVMSSFKHFPGHGSAGADTHEGLVDITNAWREYELAPYSSVPDFTMVMVAHVVNGKIDPDYPASLSAKTINGLLREKIGFDGVVISDDLQMGAIYGHYGLTETLRLAILAGNDILLLGNNLKYTENLGRAAHAEIMKMVHDGKIPRARIRESYDRIMKLKYKLK